MDPRTKNTSVVFEKKLTSFTGRPTDNARYLIQKNLGGLIENSIKEALEFSSPTPVKIKALCQLKHIIVLAEREIQQHLDFILRSIIRLYHKEDKQIDAQIVIVCELLGVYTDCGFYLPVLVKVLNEEDVKTSPRLVGNLLELSSYLICNETLQTIKEETNLIAKVIEDIENLYNDNAEIMLSGFYLVANFITVAGDLCSQYRSQLFSFLLTLQSIPSVQAQLNNKVENFLELLARHSGCNGIKELYSVEVSSVLTGFYQSKSYKSWDRTSKDRFKFDILVRNCGRGLTDFLPVILEIIEGLVAHESDLETRIDALSLVEFLIKVDEMVEQMRTHSMGIMTKILIPAAVWKAGKPLIKIRKAAIICMVQLIQKQIISEEVLQECVKDLKPVLKSCLNDDWAPDLRFISCQLLELIFTTLRESLTDIDLSDLYPHLLERLDDSQDPIRIEITRAIQSFFQCSQLKMSPGTFEYVVRGILIHLDDQNEQLQLAIFKALQTAGSIKPKLVLKEAKNSLPKQKYPKVCQELIRLIEENMPDSIVGDDEVD